MVFVGPYEHHSNEVTWRETLAEVVEVPLCPRGNIDLAALRDHGQEGLGEEERSLEMDGKEAVELGLGENPGLAQLPQLLQLGDHVGTAESRGCCRRCGRSRRWGRGRCRGARGCRCILGGPPLVLAR